MAEHNLPDERRKHPRLSKNVPIKICQEDGDIVTESWNISRCGAYCKINRYLDPMTKLNIHLLLPIKKNNKQATKKISCQGVVVRTEAVPDKDYYNVAIFFNDIPKKDADVISKYIAANMTPALEA